VGNGTFANMGPIGHGVISGTDGLPKSPSLQDLREAKGPL